MFFVQSITLLQQKQINMFNKASWLQGFRKVSALIQLSRTFTCFFGKNSQIYRYFINVQIFLVMQTYTLSCQSFIVAVSRTTLQKVLPSEIELNRCVCECMAAVLPGYIWPIKYLLFLSPFQAALWPPASFCGENKISISQSAFIKWCTMIVNAKMQFTQVS